MTAAPVFTLSFTMDSAPFTPDADSELARIFRGLARQADCTLTFHGAGTMWDSTGAVIGSWSITDNAS